MQTVQLVIRDTAYAAALRDALVRSGPWHVECAETPDPSGRCALVMDEESLGRVRLPLAYPERIVLITQKGPENLSHAWDAGIVSVVFADDPPNTVLLAIMAAALRVPKPPSAAAFSGISPNKAAVSAPIPPELPIPGSKRCKTR